MIKKTDAYIYYDTEKDIYSLKLSAPLSVCWQITTKCNLNCKYCISSSGAQGIYGLDTSTAKKIITELGQLGVNRLDFTGGEPLIRKDLGELIACAKENNISTIVTTNTLLLDEKNIEFLKNADLVQISVDGPRNIHNEQRQSNVYDKTINNISKLKQAGCKIRLNSFLFNSNKEHFDYLINLSDELEVFSHLFIIFTPQGRGRNYINEIISIDELEKLKDKIISVREKTNKNIRLYDYNEYIHSCVLLTPEGNVISQGFYEEDSVNVGSLLTNSMTDLFSNEIFDHPTHINHYLQRRLKR